MRGHLFLAAAVLALAPLLPAVAWAAGALPSGGSAVRHVTAGPGQVTTQRVAAGATAAGASTLAAPHLGIITNGPCTVTGVVQDHSGAPVGGVLVDWGYYDADGDWIFGNEVETQADGSFTFDGVIATTDGELDVYLSDEAGYQAWSLTFSAPPAENDFVLQPGIVPFSTTRSSNPAWNYWDGVVVDTWGSGGGGTTTLAETGSAYVMPPDYDRAVIYYFANQAVEWDGGSLIPVAAGGTGGTPIDVSQSDAQSVLVTKPYWASGKPGTTIGLRMGNWPAGWQAGFYGYSEYPHSYPEKLYGATYTSSGAEAVVWLTVPTNATPGYDFQIHAYRSDTMGSALDINDFFQVCTLKSTRTSVRSDAAIRLSGRVPLAGHLGSKPAPSGKRVTIFRRTTAPSAQPTSWTSPKGWTKVATVSTTRYGVYHSAYLHPKRTTWYIVRYPASSNAEMGQWYWKAFTSYLKVRVY
jgi:hypothetical protein